MTGKLINTDGTKMELRVYQLVCQLSRKFTLSILMDTGKNSNFRRSSYTLLDDARNECLTLIHYMGDHTTATHFPHGNSKSKVNKAYVRTCPSVLQTVSGSSRRTIQ